MNDPLEKGIALGVRHKTKEETVKCAECGAEATFDAPRLLCDEHWARWWSSGFAPEDQSAMYAEALVGIQREEGR